MPTWAGSTPVSAKLLLNTISTTDLVGGGLDAGTRALTGSIRGTTGANTLAQPTVFSPEHAAAQACYKALGPGDYIFERIHILPPLSAFRFILSRTLVPVEVWNAYRKVTQTVTSVVQGGPSGVSIQTAFTLPITFNPLQSRVYIVEVSADGAPRADNTIHFDFAGLSEPNAAVTGLRLLPFTISPDWKSGIEDEVAYLTDVMASYDDTEQRMMLREVPDRTLTFDAVAINEREAGLMMSLLYAWQGRSYGVPLWMDGADLAADASAGSVTLQVSTANMTLVPNVDTVIILADAFTWFASTISAFDATSISLQAPTDKDFTAGHAKVIPIQLGRLPASMPVVRPTNKTATAQVAFDLQVVVQL